ncbi:MAG: hypothetical protein WB646_19240 [Steroidobacteraceae bacterium]
MRQPVPMLAAAAIAAAMAGTTAATAAEDPGFAKDLTATIALQGQPCDRVVSTKRNGDSDYLATCHDGHRYHVFVDANGRVVVQKI